ncbi:septum site-determining protein MinC [Colwellia chukchiensis]|uniref:Probable septum site-determining protein MinC n=1 Tax=Colwellia chukchiensis TaxID=641665 RepID=A0A1H7MPX6_9GAMM|nr:septum site-determining protein MinC [Colwellia chukchiensis]SEL13129.1 septum site-determining protein MinC [Colwellia chukchiensis]
MADANIEFKGSSFTLSILHLKTSNLTNIGADLQAKVAQAPDFFHLLPVVVNVAQFADSVDYQALKTLVEAANFTFVGFTGTVSKAQRQRIRDLGFSFVNTAKQTSAEQVAAQQTNVSTNPEANAAAVANLGFSDKVHQGQIRSGQQVYAKAQNLVIIGSVSAGAEVIADGNIHVYGSLRGRAIAGARGHDKAQVYCQKLEAELVSINGHYWLSESMTELWGEAAYLQLTDSELTAAKLS